MQLVTIAFSHYNEKARWGLDRFGVDYEDQRYLPMLHFFGVMWATRLRGGRPEKNSTRWSTPLLLTDDGTRIHDSSRIVRYASDRFGTEHTSLYPPEHTARIEQIEQRVGERLGPDTRRIAYYYLLADPERLAWVMRNNTSRLQYGLYAAFSPVVRQALRRRLRVTRAGMEVSRERVRAEVEAFSDQLGDRPYLLGDRFTAADIAVSCLLAPMLAPSREEGYSARLPGPEDRPAELATFIEEVRDSPIGRHALRMFATERRRESGA